MVVLCYGLELVATVATGWPRLPIWAMLMKLIVRFDGGYLDGREYVGNSIADEEDDAALVFRLSDYGTIGKEFYFIPPEDIEAIHDLGWEAVLDGRPELPLGYIVTDCVRVCDAIMVEAAHVNSRTACSSS